MCKPDDLSLSPERAAAAAAAVLPPSTTAALSLPPTLRRCSWSSPAQLRWATSSGCSSSPCGGSVCSGGAPVVVNVAKAPPCTPVGGSRRASGAHRPWLFCVAIVALCLEKRLVRQEAQEMLRRSTESLGQQQMLLAEEEGQEEASRDFMKAGSLYQNEYMTLWNGAGVAISVTLKIEADNQFQLLVSHLNSKGRGSDGWISVTGSFGLRSAGATTAASSRLSLVQGRGGDDLVFRYDLSVLDRASAMVYRCLDRLGASGMLSVISLEVDPTEDAVYVAPTARIVRALWDEPVVLRLTDKDQIWVSDSADKKAD